MSLYSALEIAIPDNEVPLIITMSNQADNPSLAVGTATRILFYSDTGELRSYSYRKNFEPTAMAYHPVYPTLASGWRTGMISLYSEDSKIAKEEQNIHKSPITVVRFHKNGQRMLTADLSGLIVCWKGVNALIQFRRDGAITQALFITMTPETEKEKEKFKSTFIFLYGGQGGKVYFGEESNKGDEVCSVGTSVQALMFWEKYNHCIVLTSGLLFVQFKLFSDKPPERKTRISISGDPEKIASTWFGLNSFAVTSNEAMVRIWNLEDDTNYNLTVADATQTNTIIKKISGKIINSAYNSRSKTLLCGTTDGRVLAWKNMCQGQSTPTSADQWKNIPSIMINQAVTGIAIGGSSSVISLKHGDKLSMAFEITIRGCSSDMLKLLQVSSSQIQIYKKSEKGIQMLCYDAKCNIKHIDCYDNKFAVWNSKNIEVYEVKKASNDIELQLASSVSIKDKRGNFICLGKEFLIYVLDFELISLNEDGSEREKLVFSQSEGAVHIFDKNTSSMLNVTNENVIRVFDVSYRQMKQNGQSRRFENQKGSLGIIRDAKINSSGKMIAIFSEKLEGEGKTLMRPEIYIYSLNTDSFFNYTFDMHIMPIKLAWDKENSNLLGIFLKDTIEEAKQNVEAEEDAQPIKFKTKRLATFFVSPEIGIKNHDYADLDEDDESLFQIAVPYIILIKKHSQNGFILNHMPLKEFAGIENIDEVTKKAILDFNYNLTIGNMDEAYRAVKNIQNPLIWENMARMCVKTKRLDVAEICMGNIKFARGAKAVRETRNESPDVQIAMVAIQLNMRQEAEAIFKEIKRYDLLNGLYQAENNWKAAEEVAENFDRINLKNTYYQIAKNFEISKCFDQAIEYYEKSDTHIREVPRMLMKSREVGLLKEYIDAKKDPELYKFWAQYLDSQQQITESLEYFKLAEDYGNVIRLLFQLGDLNQANKVCYETCNSAACLFMGKYYESINEVQTAVMMYGKGGHYLNAVRLCRDNGLDNDLMTYALQSSRHTMFQTAKYFESKRFMEKAVVLYMKSKHLKKALQVAKDNKLYDYIKQITAETEDIENNKPDDTDNMEKMAEYFLSNNQADKAVPLFVSSGKIDKALDICIQENIPINEELVKKMLTENKNMNESTKTSMMEVIAKKARKQGNFTVAFKLFMELGKTVKAAKCLIDQGDYNSLIKFAQNARSNEIYILAANYLQTVDWYENNDIRVAILSFYSKAKSADKIANFFDFQAQVEIDDYRDYEKAIGSMQDAIKWGEKCSDGNKNERLRIFKEKITNLKEFNDARNQFSSNPEGMVEACKKLLATPNINDSVRVGDIYTLIFEYHFARKQYQEAYSIVEKVRDRGLDVGNYIEDDKVQQILKILGIKSQEKKPVKIQKFDPLAAKKKQQGLDNEDANDFQEEEVDEINE